MNKVLITGATGFIGSHVAEYFSEKKVPVVCFVRESSDTSFIKHLNAKIVFGDIKDTDSIKKALTDIDLVVHTAGRSSDWGKYSDFYTNNVTGTLNILEACRELNIKNIIITGSVSSYGEEDSDILKDESSPYNSHYNYFCDKIFPSAMNFYRDTKALLTKKSIEFAQKHGQNLTVIEPVWVYGEREFNTGFFEYLKSVNEGAGYLPGSKFNKFHVIYARDLAKAYYAAYKKKLNGVHRIIIGERNAHKMNFIYNTFCKTANLRPPVLLPKFVTYPVGFLLELTAVLFRMKEPLLLSRSRVNMMYDNIEYSTEKAMKLIDFQADTSLHDGIFKTVKWYKDNGFLDDKKNKINVRGSSKYFFTVKLKLQVAYYFFKKFLKNKKLREFLLILRRLNYFIGKISHNKFVKINDNTRLDLYIPGFPSKAFFTSCEKFAVFKEKLPCTTVLVSVTSACTYKCEHCYQRLDKGKDVDLEKLIPVVKILQDKGIAFFNIEGGEPFLVFDRLLSICREIDNRSEIWVNSTGYGITKERLLELKKTNLTAIMFSLHSYDPEKVNKFMGNDKAWSTMEKAIELCHETGIPVTFNSCLLKEDFRNGNFEKVMIQAKNFKASLIQLIKPKPSGAWLESGVEEYSNNDFELIKKKVNIYNSDKKYEYFPAISAQIIEEDPDMFGCTAGGTDRFYINAKGDVQPCEFLNISFGSINDEEFDDIYGGMRKVFEIPGNCILCEKFSKDIYKIYKENDLKTLPLDKELSKLIYENIKCENPTKLYHKIEKEMK